MFSFGYKDAPDSGGNQSNGKGKASSSGIPAHKAAGKNQATSQDTDGDIFIEATVCKVDDLKDGEMREVEVGQGKALLINQLGEFSAIGHKCTHYGAPLIKGVLSNGRVRCPWHGACFNAKTGDIEDFPGLDSVAKFEVRVDGEDVIVKSRKKALASHKRIKDMSCRSPDSDKTILIIGGGGAAATCAETLRQEGFKGHIVMATKEKHLPYDRPKLSKSLTSSGAELSLRQPDFYSVYDIDVQKDMEATAVDTLLNCVAFKNGKSISYDTLLLATGGSPRVLDIPGKDLRNVCVLRSPEDANYIAEQGKGKNVVIVGTSFIGMEMAAYFAGKASSVSIIGRSAAPYIASLGETIGKALQKMCEDKGVKFYLNSDPEQFNGDETGQLREVVLKGGETLTADLCVMGVGVMPATNFLKDSGITLNSRQAVVVDKFLKTNKPNVFAAGDIVQVPLAMKADEEVNIGHWQVACIHGRIAALNMLNQEMELDSVPYFWTMLFGKSVRYAGYNAGFEDVIIEGNPEELKFVAYYIKGDHVVAVASMNSDPVVSKFAEYIASGRELTKSDVKSDPEAWQSRL
ncbi:apoptosis-inducing factor 3-like [Acanthaster planci]|uniref:Apoptosis-inducing factor 3-like n=1 Tax=Acanthaster planci TaxID=133434 RepID=A0A8B7ZG95_ACAPL|nr:apoptosis-inducing factor 3-like [Acanthaster planci]